jgi:hypothetical protein
MNRPTKKPTRTKLKKRLSYGDLSLDDVRKSFNLTISRLCLFENTEIIEPNLWLQEVLEEGFEISVVSEKARSIIRP